MTPEEQPDLLECLAKVLPVLSAGWQFMATEHLPPDDPYRIDATAGMELALLDVIDQAAKEHP